MTNNSYPVDLPASQYYAHNSYVHTYYYTYRFLENWITKNIFRNDKSRTFLASDEYAYRRRFELTDTSKDFDTLDFSSLRLPFANYWPQNVGWEPDDRIAAKSAALTYLGIYEGSTKVRAAASTLDISTTFYFDREDDARLAYDVLYFNSFNEHYYSIKVPYGKKPTANGYSSNVLDLPMNLVVSGLEFNPKYQENDWLKKQRVFILKASFKIRTFAILPPSQPDYSVSVGVDGVLSDGSEYDDGIGYYYIVDDVILNFAKKDQKIVTCDAGFNEVDESYSGSTQFPEEGVEGTIYIDSYSDSQEDSQNKSVPVFVWDPIYKKYVSPNVGLYSLSVRANGLYEEGAIGVNRFDCISNVTNKSNLIEWSYGKNTMPESSYNELLASISAFSSKESYSKGDYCLRDGVLYVCDASSDKVVWNPSNWIEVSSVISKIELHMAGSDSIVDIDPNATSYLMEGLSSNTAYIGYVVFYTVDGLSSRFTINFRTSKSNKKETAKANSLKGFTW